MDHKHEHTPVANVTNNLSGDTKHTSHEGHSDHSGHSSHTDMFRSLFWVNLVLAVPVALFSEMLQEWFNYDAPSFPGSTLISPVLGTVIFFYGGWVFISGGYQEAKNNQPGMMLLISMAISVAYGSSLATEFGWIDLDFWWELSGLIVIMLFGHWQEMKAIGDAQGALAALAELLPDTAERVEQDGKVNEVSIDQIALGDVLLVRSGARIPADGTITEGTAQIDESMITGESRPVSKTTGNKVVAGTVSTDSAIRVEVTAIGAGSVLAGIQKLVEQAQQSQSKAQALADRAAAWLFYIATTAGILTFILWQIFGTSSQAVERTITVLIIACPHALGLAIPLVVSLSTAIAARSGILIKNRIALERMRTIDTVIFDKTGTLTKGEHIVTGIDTLTTDENEFLKIVGAVESDSEHPLAKAIVEYASSKTNIGRATGFKSFTGKGVQATVDGKTYSVGGPSLLRELKIDIPDNLKETSTTWGDRGAAVLYAIENQVVIGALALEDEIRPESKVTIDSLHAQGIKVMMITGDAQAVARSVSDELDLDEYFAEVLPKDKDKAVIELQARGHKVAMVGDGVNDAPALARADVGLAIGAGTDVAIESAGIVLASSDPRSVLGVIDLSKATYKKMVQNLAWGAGYNIFAIPLAAGALYWAGVTLAPALGAILMSLSTIVVALNAQLLRSVDLSKPPL